MSDDLSKLVQPLDAEPTDEQVASACLSYNHSFGLMIESQRVAMMQQAREWLRAWRKEIPALDPEALARWREEAVQAEREEIANLLEAIFSANDGIELRLGATSETITLREIVATIRARKGGAA
jgi:hypothetical protein